MIRVRTRTMSRACAIPAALLLTALAGPSAAGPAAGPAAAPPRIAVPPFDFTDASAAAPPPPAAPLPGMARSTPPAPAPAVEAPTVEAPTVEAPAARLAAFADRLRAVIDASGRAATVAPACAPACSPLRTPLPQMAEAARAAGASLLLAGGVKRISPAMGTVRLVLIDLPADKVVCRRELTYRGDSPEAWAKAADFAAEDLLAHCLK